MAKDFDIYEIDLLWFDEFVQHIREEYCLFLKNNFVSKMPTLKEVIDQTIEYCNASDQSYDDNVYLITFPSGKKYMGQTVDIIKRFSSYRKNKGSNPHMSRALNKYGFCNIHLEHHQIPTSCTDFVEIFMIYFYDLVNCKNGYNKTTGGKSGWVMTEEVRKRLSAAHTGVPLSEKHRASMGKSRIGVPRDQAVCMKISVAKKGVPLSKEHCIALSDGWTDERRTIHKNVRTGVPLNAEWRSAISASKKGVPLSENHRLAMGVARTGERHPQAKKVCVDGTLYTCAKEAAIQVFPEKYKNHVSNFIHRLPNSERMFYISKEFYMYCKENGIEDVTRTMYNGFEHYMNNLL
jgi:hypothetical protein